MIKFNIPPFTGKEPEYMMQAIKNHKICGDGYFTQLCNKWLETSLKVTTALLTTSCTHALEMSAILANIKPKDEVIVSSFTFVSTVNAFALRGAQIRFVDINPKTMNINENLIEQAITKKTKAIIPMHYAGVACDMDAIMNLAQKYQLYVIEDAAQCIMASYKGKELGSIGDFGTFSFHETKNYSMGEGGALVINQEKFTERAEIIREKGTNRTKFYRGMVDKYSWVDIGSSYLPSELNAAYLWAQFELANKINDCRLDSWNKYYTGLHPLVKKGDIELPYIPSYAKHNGHIFYIKLDKIDTRTKLVNYLKRFEIESAFHYIPLHTSNAGTLYGKFIGEDEYTTKESERLLRLPMYYGLKEKDISFIIDKINNFFGN